MPTDIPENGAFKHVDLRQDSASVCFYHSDLLREHVRGRTSKCIVASR